jgi:hypothetical protein
LSLRISFGGIAEQHVVALAAVNQVVARTRAGNKRKAFAQQRIVTAAAQQQVVAATSSVVQAVGVAKQHIRPRPTGDPVVAPSGIVEGSFRNPGCWMVGASCHQGGDKFAEEGFAAAAGVMHELEEVEIERQLLLRDAAMRP